MKKLLTRVLICCLMLSSLQIVMAKVLEQGPVMVLTFQAQQLTRKLTADGDVEDVSVGVCEVWRM